jgi:hypothetical protein
MAKKEDKASVEKGMAEAFKRAGEKARIHLSKLVNFDEKYAVFEDDDGEGGPSGSGIGDFTEADLETIEDGNEDLQKILMEGEKAFGEVSKDRRGRPSKEQQHGMQQQSGLPHHPLLAETQRFDGISPNESPEATVNPEITQMLEDHLESNPELVNNPQLKAALEHRKQMKAQLSQASTPTLNR